MTWQCVECVQAKMDVVCHHCGKPLCKEDAYRLVDDALSNGSTGSTRDIAVHCKECRQRHHPRAVLVGHQRIQA